MSLKTKFSHEESDSEKSPTPELCFCEVLAAGAKSPY